MTKNSENTLKIDEILGELQYLKEENKQLKADNKVLGDELTYFKEYSADLECVLNRKETILTGVRQNNSNLTVERNDLQRQVFALSYELRKIKTLSMFEFADKYCSDEILKADGKAFAKSLGVGQ